MGVPVHGKNELEARYGRLIIGADPRGGYRILSPIGWETKWMVSMYNLPGLQGRKLYVNRDIVDPLKRALESWQKQCPEYAIRTIGCWSVRYKRTATKQVSLHAFGLALDLNADTNPMRRPLTTDMPPLFVDCFVREGFTWGARFPTPDPQHFQLASGV